MPSDQAFSARFERGLPICAELFTPEGNEFARWKVEKATGCRDADAVHFVLGELERRVELVKARVMTAREDAAAAHADTPLQDRFPGYLASLWTKGASKGHLGAHERYLKRLADLSRKTAERWLLWRSRADAKPAP